MGLQQAPCNCRRQRRRGTSLGTAPGPARSAAPSRLQCSAPRTAPRPSRIHRPISTERSYALFRLTLALAISALLAACESRFGDEGTLPPIPEPILGTMSSEARELIGSATSHALANPDEAEANGRLGMAFHAYEFREESIACYRRAAALDPRDWRWAYYLGIVRAELGRYGDAATDFESVLSIRPELASGWLRLGESLLKADDPAQGREAFERAVELSPTSALAHFGLGKALDAVGDSERALDPYLRAVQLEPGAGAVRYALALLYRKLGRMEDAERQLAHLENRNRMEPSIEDSLMAAVRALRTDKRRYLQEGLELEAEGKLQEALALYEKAVAIDGSYLQARINLIAGYGRLGRFREAEVHYLATKGLASDSEELHVNWGMLETERKNFSAAVLSYRRALEINPHSADTHADLGAVLDRVGEADEALLHFRLALQNEPDHRLANFHLARFLISENRVTEAIDHLLRAKEPLDERTPTYIYGLADAYLRLGNVELSLRYLREAAALANEFGQSDLLRAILDDIHAIEAMPRP